MPEKRKDLLKAAEHLGEAAVLLEPHYWQFARDIQIKGDYCKRRVEIMDNYPFKKDDK